jgi:hypothetical protein
MPTLDEQAWLARTRDLADQGDPRARMDLAFAYWHGRIVPKDARRAESLLRQAEKSLGDEAWLEIIRILFWENDPRIKDIFNERSPESNGAACFIYGHYLHARGDLQEAIRIYGIGGQAGHFGCAIRYHKLTHRGIRTVLGIPRLLQILARGFKIAWQNENDTRWRK